MLTGRMPCVPPVTILMPVYNGERFLDEAVASVLGQDFADFEFVIVDDGSTDATAAMLRRWAVRDARVVIVTLPENRGIPVSLNLGLAIARGRYVARQDADDICLPGRLKKQVEVLDREPDTVLVSAGYDLIDERGRRVGREMRVELPEVTAYLLHFSNAIGGHGQVMFRREAVAAAGDYDETLALSEDYDLWTRLARIGDLRLLPIVGMQHRLHTDRSSIRGLEIQRRRSLTISRRMLTELLRREVTKTELAAVSSVWRQEGQPGVAASAHATLAESYGQFVARGATRMQRSRVRLATSRRWLLAATTLARRGLITESLLHIGYALLWHPLGVLAVLPHLMRRIAYAWQGMTERVLLSYEPRRESNNASPLA